MNKILARFHLQATAKSLGAAIGGVVIIAVAFNRLSKDQAEAITIGLAPVLALLMPSRADASTAPNPAPEGQPNP